MTRGRSKLQEYLGGKTSRLAVKSADCLLVIKLSSDPLAETSFADVLISKDFDYDSIICNFYWLSTHRCELSEYLKVIILSFSLRFLFWKSFYFKRKHPTFNLNLDKIQIILTFFPVKFYLASIVIELVLILKRIIAFRSLLKRKKIFNRNKLIWRVYVNGYDDQPSFDKNQKYSFDINFL